MNLRGGGILHKKYFGLESSGKSHPSVLSLSLLLYMGKPLISTSWGVREFTEIIIFMEHLLCVLQGTWQCTESTVVINVARQKTENISQLFRWMSIPIYTEVSRHYRFLSVTWKQTIRALLPQSVTSGWERPWTQKLPEVCSTKETGGVIIICFIQFKTLTFSPFEIHFDTLQPTFQALCLALHTGLLIRS